MKLKRIFFVTAIMMFITSACQNSAPALTFNAVPKMYLLTLLEDTNSLPLISDAACDDSIYLEDITIADGTKIQPNTAFIKKWKVQNTGDCAWNKRYALKFISGDSMAGETTYLRKWVPPGKAIVLSVDMIAPTAEGIYTSNWALTNSSGAPFGSVMSAKITVTHKKPKFTN